MITTHKNTHFLKQISVTEIVMHCKIFSGFLKKLKLHYINLNDKKKKWFVLYRLPVKGGNGMLHPLN